MKALYDDNTSVQDDFEEIARLPGMSVSAGVMAKYAVAVAMRDLCVHRAYGDGMVRQLCEHIGWSKSIIHQHMAVVRYWPTATEFMQAAIRTNAKGIQLSWSFFPLLASVPDDEMRELLYQLLIEESWQCRRLQKEVADVHRATPSRPGVAGRGPRRKAAVDQLREVINCGTAVDASTVARQRAAAGVEFLMERVSFFEIEKLLAGEDKSPQKVA